MANPHHRKKHKEHLKNFKHEQVHDAVEKKSKPGYFLIILGALVGFGITYFASNQNMAVMAGGFFAGGALGYWASKQI